MSVVSKNPFDLLGDDGEESSVTPVKVAPAPAAAAQQPKVVPGSAPKGGRGVRAPARVPGPKVEDGNVEGTENAGGFGGERVPPPKKHHQGPDAHTKGPREGRENRRGGFTSGGHRSRGAGSVAGSKVPAQGGERRQYERRAGPQDSQKKVEQGWGADDGKAELTAEIAGEGDAKVEENVPQTPAGEEEPVAATEVEGEAEPETKSYEQYLAEQAEKALGALGKKEGRQVNAESLEGKAFVRETIDEFFNGKQKEKAAKEKAAKKEKVYIEVDGQFASPAGSRPPRTDRPERNGEGGARGRGGFRGGEGRGRGAPRGARGGAGAPRGAPRSAASANINTSDEKAFPALGA